MKGTLQTFAVIRLTNMPVERRKTAVSVSRRWCIPLKDKEARREFITEFYDMEVVHGTHYFGKRELHIAEKFVTKNYFFTFLIKKFLIQNFLVNKHFSGTDLRRVGRPSNLGAVS